jgi:hypothetical protein
MSYVIILAKAVQEKIISWNLPGYLVDELKRQLNEVLASNPGEHLRRIRSLFDHSQFSFTVPDISDPCCHHSFLFHVTYGEDKEENTLKIRNCGYSSSRRTGPPSAGPFSLQ